MNATTPLTPAERNARIADEVALGAPRAAVAIRYEVSISTVNNAVKAARAAASAELAEMAEHVTPEEAVRRENARVIAEIEAAEAAEDAEADPNHWVELSTDDAADMSEVFAAQAEADEMAAIQAEAEALDVINPRPEAKKVAKKAKGKTASTKPAAKSTKPAAKAAAKPKRVLKDFIYTRATREGDVLTVARPASIGAADEGRWVTFCEKHSTLVYSDNQGLAERTRGADFCDDCREGKPATADEAHIAAQIKASLDFWAAERKAAAARKAANTAKAAA